MFKKFQKSYLTIFVLAILCATYGCSKSRTKTVQVSGQVTLNGGKWPGKGTITFRRVNVEQGQSDRPGMAMFDEEGKFTAFTYEANDGLVPGDYDIIILYSKPRVSGDDVNDKPIKASDKLTVPADSGPIEYTFDVKN